MLIKHGRCLSHHFDAPTNSKQKRPIKPSVLTIFWSHAKRPNSGGADAIKTEPQPYPADVAEAQPKPSRGYRKSCQNGLNFRARGEASKKHVSVSEATLTA